MRSHLTIPTRRAFLRLGAAGIAGLGVTTVRPARASACTVATAVGIAPGNPAAVNRANLVAALQNSSACLTFPPGDYLIDNSGPYIVVNNFSGELVMQAGARFVFTDKTRRGLNFEGGAGARFRRLTTTFTQPLPAARIGSEECVIFLNTTDTLVEDADINGSAAAGLLFYRCIRPTVRRSVVRNTMADGLHFANCQDAYVDTLQTNTTGDDGLAFVDYESGPAYTGGYARNINVAYSRARGIAVVGQRGVTIEDFTVSQTAVSGIYCASENAYRTRVPSNVTFRNGSVDRGGGWTGQAGNRFGLEYANVGTGIAFEGVTVRNSGTRGVSGTARPFTRIRADGSSVAEPAGSLRMTRVTAVNSAEGGVDLQGGTYDLDFLTVDGANRTGFYAAGCARVDYLELVVTNAARTDSLRRAVCVENNAVVAGTSMRIRDTQPVATGYVVGAYGSQSGSLGTIYDEIASRNVVVDNPSGLSYTLV